MSRLILVIADDRPSRQREFDRSALVAARLWNTAEIIPVRSGQDVLRAVQSQRTLISHLTLLGHGWPRRWLSKRAGVDAARHEPPTLISVERFGRILAAHATSDLHVAVAACSCAADPGESRWSAASYGPGGANSWCAALYAVLSSHSPHAVVVGHSAPGHATRNPALRAWGRDYGQGIGASVLDHCMGDGAWRLRSERRSWIEWCASETWDGYRMSEILLLSRPRKNP